MEFVEIEVECQRCHKICTLKQECFNGLEAEKFTQKYTSRRYKHFCADCIEQKLHEEAVKRAAEMKLPHIIGVSTKQISYAFKLRDAYVRKNHHSLIHTQNVFSRIDEFKIPQIAVNRRMSEDDLMFEAFKQLGLLREYLCLTEPNAQVLIDHLKPVDTPRKKKS